MKKMTAKEIFPIIYYHGSMLVEINGIKKGEFNFENLLEVYIQNTNPFTVE